MNSKFFIKMMQAKKMEYEAMKELIPENIESHLHTIKNEFVEMMSELLLKDEPLRELVKQMVEKDKAEPNTSDKKVQKVTIES